MSDAKKAEKAGMPTRVPMASSASLRLLPMRISPKKPLNSSCNGPDLPLSTMRDTAAEKALAARADRHLHADKITSTPTFVINGRRVEGEMTLPELDAAIAQAAR